MRKQFIRSYPICDLSFFVSKIFRYFQNFARQGFWREYWSPALNHFHQILLIKFWKKLKFLAQLTTFWLSTWLPKNCKSKRLPPRNPTAPLLDYSQRHCLTHLCPTRNIIKFWKTYSNPDKYKTANCCTEEVFKMSVNDKDAGNLLMGAWRFRMTKVNEKYRHTINPATFRVLHHKKQLFLFAFLFFNFELFSWATNSISFITLRLNFVQPQSTSHLQMLF